MSNTQPAFSLTQVYFVRSVVVAVRDFKEGTSDMGEPLNEVEVIPDAQNPGLYIASMRCRINPDRLPAHPYEVDMECVCGLRLVDTSLDAATAFRGATITAHSVLYGAIREAVASITGRQPWGPLMLGLSVLTPPATPQEVSAPTAAP